MIGEIPTMIGAGATDITLPEVDSPQADASPLTTHVGPVLRDVSEPETCGRVCAVAGIADVSIVPAVSMLMIHVRIAFSPFHSGDDGAPVALGMQEMNAPVVPGSQDYVFIQPGCRGE